MKKLVGLLAGVLMLAGGVNAQQLGILTDSIFFPDTATFGQSANIEIVIRNEDSNSLFTGTYQIFLGVEEQGQIIVRDSFPGQQTTINPGEFESQIITNIFTEANFSLGGNTVVVWPAADAVPTGDTLFRPLWMLDPLAGQPDTIGISQGSFNFPDSVSVGTLDSIAFRLENRGVSYIDYPVNVFLGVNNGDLTVRDTIVYDEILAPGTSVELKFYETFESAAYRPGGNTVVVWPAAPQIIVEDSLRQMIAVAYPSAIEDHPNWQWEADLVAYPNPVQNELFFQLDGQQMLPERVRIMDLSGRVLDQQIQMPGISLESFAPGTYIVEVLLDESRFKSFKVIKR